MQHIEQFLDTIAEKPSSTPSEGAPSGRIPRPENSYRCPDCKDAGWFRRDVPPSDPDFGRPVRCDNPVHRPEWLARLAARSNLLPEDLDTRLKDIKVVHFFEPVVGTDGKPLLEDGTPKRVLRSNQAMLEAARSLVQEPRGFLYVWGPWGNAKSEALIAIVNEVNLDGGGLAMYIKFSDLVEYMREAYADRDRRKALLAQGDLDADMTYWQRFERLKDIPVLAIDEFDFDDDKVRETGLVKQFRFDFLDVRYHQAIRGKTATVFASNSPPDALPDAIYSRVRDGRFTIVHNTAPDSRPAMRRKPAAAQT
jgi:hypothetical protein